MRTFTQGTGSDRKFVVIEVDGPVVRVTEGKTDGSTKRKERELKSEESARSASEKMANELISRGFVEQSAASRSKSKPAAAEAKPAARAAAAREPKVSHAFDDLEGPAVAAAPVLPRLAPSATAEAAPKKKKKSGGKKKQKKAQNPDGLDKRVLAGVAAIGVALFAGAGYLVYDTFLKPPSITGTWQGSRLEYEVSVSLSHSRYRLVLDEAKRASMTVQDNFTSSGTYTVKGNRLKLILKDEDGDPSELEYKISLGHTTLDLFDLNSGKKVVQLVRQSEKPSVGAKPAPPPEAPKDTASGVDGKVDQAADDRLASTEFTPKDGAFKVRYPGDWDKETGSRPDNTYSWVRFTKGSAKIQVFADVTGSLMSGSDHAGQHEEGSSSAPVHRAHELYKKTASEEYSDYKESEPTLFKSSRMGEGRIATFTASGGGLFGSKLRGYRVTFLTTNRRITVLCSCPDGEFTKLKPTLLAVCRSISG
jgi:Lipocalin-like domain